LYEKEASQAKIKLAWLSFQL